MAVALLVPTFTSDPKPLMNVHVFSTASANGDPTPQRRLPVTG